MLNHDLDVTDLFGADEMDISVEQYDESDLVAASCAGTFGTFGSYSGTAGTFGTFGCFSNDEPVS
jgi:hypothetical protein